MPRNSRRAEVRDLAAACGLQEDERVPLTEVASECMRKSERRRSGGVPDVGRERQRTGDWGDGEGEDKVEV
jgi:hypothetical protein